MQHVDADTAEVVRSSGSMVQADITCSYSVIITGKGIKYSCMHVNVSICNSM